MTKHVTRHRELEAIRERYLFAKDNEHSQTGLNVLRLYGPRVHSSVAIIDMATSVTLSVIENLR